MKGVDDWMAFFRENLPEATEEECLDLAQAAQDHVHQGHMIIQVEAARQLARNQATADFLNSLPCDEG